MLVIMLWKVVFIVFWWVLDCQKCNNGKGQYFWFNFGASFYFQYVSYQMVIGDWLVLMRLNSASSKIANVGKFRITQGQTTALFFIVAIRGTNSKSILVKSEYVPEWTFWILYQSISCDMNYWRIICIGGECVWTYCHVL